MLREQSLCSPPGDFCLYWMRRDHGDAGIVEGHAWVGKTAQEAIRWDQRPEERGGDRAQPETLQAVRSEAVRFWGHLLIFFQSLLLLLFLILLFLVLEEVKKKALDLLELEQGKL